jgi:hypothetical protein
MPSDEHAVWQGHRKEAKRGPPYGPHVTRLCGAIVALLLTGTTTWLSLIAVWFSRGVTHRGQPWTSAWTLPHGRDGLSARRMAALCTFRKPSMCRQVHRQCMRNALLDLTPIVPATACHQRNDVETYNRFTALLKTNPRPPTNPQRRLYRNAAQSCRAD